MRDDALEPYTLAIGSYDVQYMIGRNDPCWCGSGQKFKKCHLGRADERPAPLRAAANELRRFFKIKQCLHPLASPGTCGKVVAAHTIQAKGPLDGIVDETGHCLGFDPFDGRGSPEPQRRGWKEASTFAGFCDRHDGPTFSPLEAVRFVGSAEQCFLIAYRAECHELYQKQAIERSHEPMRQLADRGEPSEVQREIQERYSAHGAGVKKALAEILPNKTRMDNELLNGNFSGWRHLFIRFDGAPCVVSTGAPTPNRTLSGKTLQVLHDPSATIQRMYVGVVRDGRVGGVVFAWRAEDRAPEEFVGELRALPTEALPGMVVQFMFAYIGNTYFSATWWNSLSTGQKAHIRQLATMGNPYCTTWSYIPNLGVPWEAVDLTEHWPAD